MAVRQTAKEHKEYRELLIIHILGIQRRILVQLDYVQLQIMMADSYNILQSLATETNQPLKMAESDIGIIGEN